MADLISFMFAGLREAAALGAGRVNVQGWGEALINPQLLDTVRQSLEVYRSATATIIRRAQAAGQIAQGVDPVALSNALLSLYYGLELQLALDPQLDVNQYALAVRVLLNSVQHRS